MGGEKAFYDGPGQGAQGSPPRGRGKGEQEKTPCAREGITPAWAGKRTTAGATHEKRPDHPRVDGEKLANIGDDIGDDGLPLLVQKLFNFTLTHDSCGIFWCFGRCFNQLCNQLKITVHFRCCHFIHVLTFFPRELPLHSRERLCKRSCNSPCPDYSRLGGKKMEIMLDVWTYQGSPPPGGEKMNENMVYGGRQGSPPHRRGKVTGYLEQRRFIGITPAWAGKRNWVTGSKLLN